MHTDRWFICNSGHGLHLKIRSCTGKFPKCLQLENSVTFFKRLEVLFIFFGLKTRSLKHPKAHSRGAVWNLSYLIIMQMFTSQAVSQVSHLLWRERGFMFQLIPMQLSAEDGETCSANACFTVLMMKKGFKNMSYVSKTEMNPTCCADRAE